MTALQRLRQELERKHLDLMRVEAVNRKLAAHIGKYDGLFARLCVVWHSVENVGARHHAAGRSRKGPPARRQVPARLSPAARAELLQPAFSTRPTTTTRSPTSPDTSSPTASKNDPARPAARPAEGHQRHDCAADRSGCWSRWNSLGWLTQMPGPRNSSPPQWLDQPGLPWPLCRTGARDARADPPECNQTSGSDRPVVRFARENAVEHCDFCCQFARAREQKQKLALIPHIACSSPRPREANMLQQISIGGLSGHTRQALAGKIERRLLRRWPVSSRCSTAVRTRTHAGIAAEVTAGLQWLNSWHVRRSEHGDDRSF